MKCTIGESDLTYSYSLCRTCSSDTGERGGSLSCCLGNWLPREVAVATPGCSFGRIRDEGSASLQGQISHPVINKNYLFYSWFTEQTINLRNGDTCGPQLIVMRKHTKPRLLSVQLSEAKTTRSMHVLSHQCSRLPHTCHTDVMNGTHVYIHHSGCGLLCMLCNL